MATTDFGFDDRAQAIAIQADISKAAASRALEAFIGGVKSTLKKGNSVSLVGFGTFAVSKRAARSISALPGRKHSTSPSVSIWLSGSLTQAMVSPGTSSTRRPGSAARASPGSARWRCARAAAPAATLASAPDAQILWITLLITL